MKAKEDLLACKTKTKRNQTHQNLEYMKSTINKNEINEIKNRIAKNIQIRTGLENYLPPQIVKEMKENPETFNASIIANNNSFDYIFTYYCKNEFISLQYPVQHCQGYLDTKALLAFCCICADNMGGHEEEASRIHDVFKDSVIKVLLDNDIKVITE